MKLSKQCDSASSTKWICSQSHWSQLRWWWWQIKPSWLTLVAMNILILVTMTGLLDTKSSGSLEGCWDSVTVCCTGVEKTDCSVSERITIPCSVSKAMIKTVLFVQKLDRQALWEKVVAYNVSCSQCQVCTVANLAHRWLLFACTTYQSLLSPVDSHIQQHKEYHQQGCSILYGGSVFWSHR